MQDIMQRNRSWLSIVLVTQPQANNNHRLDKQGCFVWFFERVLVNEWPIWVEQLEIKPDIMSFLFGATADVVSGLLPFYVHPLVPKSSAIYDEGNPLASNLWCRHPVHANFIRAGSTTPCAIRICRRSVSLEISINIIVLYLSILGNNLTTLTYGQIAGGK